MKLLISAAEASSDAHGAELLKAIRELQPKKHIEAFGIGGPKLKGAGLKVIVDARELLSMGFFEILTKLPRIFRALGEISRAAANEKPDLAIVLDYPDFHFRLAKRLKASGIPVFYFIPPKVWAWRKRRVQILSKVFSKILCILPFEEEFFQKNGVSARFVGNPLMDELPLKMTRSEARTNLGLGSHEVIIVLLPGSRPSELSRHLDLMLDSAQETALRMRELGKLGPDLLLKILIPLSETTDSKLIQEKTDRWLRRQKPAAPAAIDARISLGNAHQCLIAADAGIVKSGTSTLEAALLGCPHVVVYKPNWVTCFLFKYLIRYQGPIGLVNLVGEPLAFDASPPYRIRELVCGNARASEISKELYAMAFDLERRAEVLNFFGKIRNDFTKNESPSRIAAREVLDFAAGEKSWP